MFCDCLDFILTTVNHIQPIQLCVIKWLHESHNSSWSKYRNLKDDCEKRKGGMEENGLEPQAGEKTDCGCDRFAKSRDRFFASG